MGYLAIHTAVYNLAAVAALLLIVMRNPRLMMQDYPAEITAGLPEKTEREKKETLMFGLPFLLILLLYPAAVGAYGKFVLHDGFLTVLGTVFLLSFSFNAIDLLILDWFLFCLITPRFMVLPGTEGHPGYKNYLFHFIGFLKGTVITGTGALVIAGLLEGVSAVFFQ